MSASMNNLLVVSALGQDRPGIVNELSLAILNCGCNIEDSRMTVLGGEFAVILLVSGNWSTIAKLENALTGLEQRLVMTITSKRTEVRRTPDPLLPYTVEVVSIDHPGIVHNLAEFFSSREINIQELTTGSYAAAHTGAPMFSIHMTVNIAAGIPIAALREEFMDFCDALNLDAIMEPIKG